MSLAERSPRCAVAHVGLTVPDLDRAIDWYVEVLGFQLLAGPIALDRNDEVAADVFGERFGALRQAHLTGLGGAGVELFEFLEPRTEAQPPEFAYWRTGLSHFCVVVPDPDALIARITSTGGRLRTRRLWRLFADEPFAMAYCEDPFGNPIEIYSHSYERIYANRPT
jgi:catechol 2,3-dioxygenase-like lactoylglutathione lyase family enzyme